MIMKCPQCSNKMVFKGIERVGNSEDVREKWECNNCNYIYFKKPS